MNQYSIKHPKISPDAVGRRPDGSPDNEDRVEIGPTDVAFTEWADLGLTMPNLDRMRETRLQRVCGELQKRDYAAALLFDPLNIRYASDSSNMHVWILHNFARAVFVSVDGYMVVFEFQGCNHLSDHLPLVKEIRHGAGFFYFEGGDKSDDLARDFAGQVDSLMREHCGDNRRLAVDKIEIPGYRALTERGIEIQYGQEVLEHARLVKGDDELNAMRCAIATCEIAMEKMHDALAPGIAEVELWSILHAENIKRCGEWIETRILNSGPRTNPWMQEAGPRRIKDGELLAFDTDLVGPYGMCSDLSRAWYCGDGKPSDEQRRIYQFAYEHIMTNRELLKPGVGFRELTEKCHDLTDEFRDQRYGVMMHGVGLCDEFPMILYPEDFIDGAFEYELQPGMTLCVEVYAGAVGGQHGVKLENQVLITETGYEDLTSFPFDEGLLAS